ncbi:MAG: O-antigen ligase family protein [Candidatus Zixiibacteriota bacterium]|nr:MAG: O-antigen ligase family protein [candidate division Zixibacteria bacterium]
MMLIVPTVLICVVILRDPYYGVYLYFLYIYLRPYEFIPVLGALRLTMFIEIITLISWILKLMKTKGIVKWNTFSSLFLGFIGVIGITVITAENNFFAYTVFMVMLVVFIIFIVATNVVDSVSRLQKIIWILLIIHFYFAIKGINTFVTGSYYAAGQYTSGHVGGGYIGDENDFALAINMMIPYAFFGVFYFKGKAKLISIALLVTFVFAIISSFSRGGLVGLVCLLLYCIFSSGKKLLSLGLIVALIISMGLFAPASYWEEAETIQEIDQGTANARIEYWKTAFRMFIDNPVVGVGAGNGGIHMPAYIRGVKDPNTQWGRAFHGTFPQIIAELGVLGSFFYFSMIIIVFRLLYRIKTRKVGEGGSKSSQYIANSIIGSLIGYFVCSAFLSTAYYPHLWATFSFAAILIFCDRNKGEHLIKADEENVKNPTL